MWTFYKGEETFGHHPLDCGRSKKATLISPLEASNQIISSSSGCDGRECGWDCNHHGYGLGHSVECRLCGIERRANSTWSIRSSTLLGAPPSPRLLAHFGEALDRYT